MIDQGVPCENDITNDKSVVFSFPIKSPDGSITKNNLTAVDHLELWKVINNNWCEHKPSITVSVKDNEWMDVGAWVWNNWDACSGISFLPFFENETVYKQLPYETVSEEKYNELNQKMPKEIDWSKLSEYEKEDTTTGSREFACSGSEVCEIVDIGK